MRKAPSTHSVADYIRHFLLAWLIAVTVEYLLLPSTLRDLSILSSLQKMSLLRLAAITLCGILGLSLLSRKYQIAAIERWSIAGFFLILAGFSLFASFTWAYFTVCAAILVGLIVYSKLGWDNSPEPIAECIPSRKCFVWITAGLSLLFFLFVSIWTVGRIYSFSTPSYDFGIFSQMFYSMKETGLPMTTIERDTFLSHFHVHMSPIYYLMLPFYCLLPIPATLQVLQAAVITSAVIPLWKIGKQHGLPDWQRMVLCILLLLFPAFAGGTSYDIHENCFLTPLILWLFYGIDRKSTWMTALFGLLTLMVKEDAAVYVAVIALWLIVRSLLHYRKGENKDLVTGGLLLAVSLIWFFLVTGYLAAIGDGVMTYRYDNFIYDGSSSLLTVVKAVLLNPMKAVYECVDPEKLQFIALTMLPLMGLPLITRRYERYILLIPYLLVNLMSDYRYQHDIFFQYTFGSTACLLYLTAVNLSDLKVNWQRFAALMAAGAVSSACFSFVVVPKAIAYPVRAVKHFDYYQEIRDTLSQIPEGHSVAASTFYTTMLSQREILYDVDYCSEDHLLHSEYVVLSKADMEESEESSTESLPDLLLKNGYSVHSQISNVLTIFVKEQQ